MKSLVGWDGWARYAFRRLKRVPLAPALVSLLLFCPLKAAILAERLTVEDLIARHLESVAPQSVREKWKNIVIDGVVQLRFIVLGSGTIQGTLLFFSEGPRFRLDLDFDHPEYQGEDVVYDGKDFAVAHSTPTARSPLGRFLHSYNGILKEGLLGSVLSTAWPLRALQEKRPELRYEGLKTVDGSELHCLRYRSRRMDSRMRVRLYFDQENFRHLKSVYEMEITAPIDRNPRQIRTARTTYKLEETFRDFKSFNGLTLPSSWGVRFSVRGNVTLVWEWDLRCRQVAINTPLG